VDKNYILKYEYKINVKTVLTTLSNYCFDLSLEGVINRGGVINKDYFRKANYSYF